ncbi:MAG: sugar phosphate isomerase/epimerase family protein [Bryobacteraceae bacterium]
MNRRNFVKTGAGLAAMLTSMPASSPAAASGKRTLRKAIMYETVGLKGSVMEKFQAVKAAGFEGIEPLSHMDQEEVLAAFKATGLKPASVCCSTHWKKPLSDPDPAVRAEGVKGMQQALRDAKAYGATSVLLVPAVVNQKVPYNDAYSRSQEEIRKLVPLATELNVRIAIENVWNHFIMTPLEAARYVDEFQSPAVGWHFDVGNIIAFGWPEQWIRILNKRIAKLHIKEFSRTKMDKEGLWKGFDVDFLDGDDDWPAVMKALDDIGYNGWGIAEQPGGDTPEGLHHLSTKMDVIFAS